MHRASTRYTKRSSPTKPRQCPGQFSDSLPAGEGGDLRRKILQRTHSIASRSTSNSSATTTPSPGSTNKSRSPGLESMSAFLTAPRRSTSPMSSPSSGHSPSPVPSPLSALENYHRHSLYPSPKQVLSSPAPGSKDREDVDITDYYSESIRKRGLYTTPFSDLPNPSSSPPLSSSYAENLEGIDSIRDLDFGLHILLARQMLGTNGVQGIQCGQDRNTLNPAFGSALGPSHVPLDGDIGEGVPMESDSDRRRGVNRGTSMGDRDAGASDNASVGGFDIGSWFPATKGAGAVKPSGNAVEERYPFADRNTDDGDITNGAKSILDSPYEADICDVELTSLSPQVGCEHTFTSITPPHAFNAFVPNRPPPCRFKSVSRLPISVF